MGPGRGTPGQIPGGGPGRGGRGSGHGGPDNGHYYPPRHYNGRYYYNDVPFFGALFFGGWGFGLYAGYPFAYDSPFYDYGFPYVYSPSVVVVQQPAYTYSVVPSYEYGNGYYLSQGAYSGLDQAVSDITDAWLTGQSGLLLKHADAGTQVAVYLDGDYSYSLSGADYANMVRDAMGHIRTTGFNVTGVERRSDGAYTITGRHDFYDANDNYKSVDVSYTLARSGGGWVIVAVGSSSAGS